MTVDAELAARARRAAYHRGTSLSGLMEGALRDALSGQKRRSPGFVERWSGRFRVAENPGEDVRLAALKAKHSLP